MRTGGLWVLTCAMVLIGAVIVGSAGVLHAEDELLNDQAVAWINRLERGQQRAAARAALAGMKGGAVPALRDAYKQASSPRMRDQLIRLLSRAEPSSLKPLLPHLREVLANGEDMYATRDALRLVSVLGTHAADLVPLVIEYLGRERHVAFSALMKIPSTAEHLPAVLKRAATADDLDRVPFAQLLLAVAPGRVETDAFVEALLEDDDSKVRVDTLALIRQAKQVPEATRVRWVLTLLRDTVPRVRKQAVSTLESFSASRTQWQDQVIALLDDDSLRVRTAVLRIVCRDVDLASHAIPQIVSYARRTSPTERQTLAESVVILGQPMIEAAAPLLAMGDLRPKTQQALHRMLASESLAWAVKQLNEAPPEMLEWLRSTGQRARIEVPPPGALLATWVDAAILRIHRGDLPSEVVRGLIERFAAWSPSDRQTLEKLLDLVLTLPDEVNRRIAVHALKRSPLREVLLKDRWLTASDEQAALYLQIAPHMKSPPNAYRARLGATRVSARHFADWLLAKSAILRGVAAKVYFSGGSNTRFAFPKISEEQREVLRAYLQEKLERGSVSERERILRSPRSRRLLGAQWGITVLSMMDDTQNEVRRRTLSFMLAQSDGASFAAVESVLLARASDDDEAASARAVSNLAWMAAVRNASNMTDSPYRDVILKGIARGLESKTLQVRKHAREAASALGPAAAPLRERLFAYVQQHPEELGTTSLSMLIRVFPDDAALRKRVIQLWQERGPGWKDVPIILVGLNAEWAELAMIGLIDEPKSEGYEHWWGAIGNIRRARVALRDKLRAWKAQLAPGSDMLRQLDTHLNNLPK